MMARTHSSLMSSRWFTRVLAALLLAAAMFVLPGCGGVEGTYVASQKDPAGDMTKLTLELKSGGVCSMTISSGKMSLPTVTGTYSVDGDRITVALSGDKDVFTRKGSTLTANFMGESVEFKKQ